MKNLECGNDGTHLGDRIEKETWEKDVPERERTVQRKGRTVSHTLGHSDGSRLL